MQEEKIDYYKIGEITVELVSNIFKVEQLAKEYDCQLNWISNTMDLVEGYTDPKLTIIRILGLILQEDAYITTINEGLKWHTPTIEKLKQTLCYNLNFEMLTILNSLLLMYMGEYDNAYSHLSMMQDRILDGNQNPEKVVGYGYNSNKSYFLDDDKYHSRRIREETDDYTDQGDIEYDRIVKILLVRDLCKFFCDNASGIEVGRIKNVVDFEESLLSNLFYPALESASATHGQNFKIYMQFLMLVISMQDGFSQFHYHLLKCKNMYDNDADFSMNNYSPDYSFTYKVLDKYIENNPDNCVLLKHKVNLLLSEIPHVKSIEAMKKYCNMGLALNIENDFFSKRLEEYL